MPRQLFVTTALPYANDNFHIGHIMEYIQADRKLNRISTIIASFWAIKNLPIGVCLDDCTGPVGRGFSRFVAMTRFGRRLAQPCPAALAKPLLPSLTNSTYQLTR